MSSAGEGTDGATFYKVLIGDQSCHGGHLRWPLPTFQRGTWTPGAWVSVEGTLTLCEVGLHLTRVPVLWYLPESTLYQAESQGECLEGSDDKRCVRTARLLRRVPWEEGQVYHEGTHEVTQGRARAYDTAVVEAYGTAVVEAHDTAVVEAHDTAVVEAHDTATVRAYGTAVVEAHDTATVRAYGTASVRAYGTASVRRVDG